MKLVADRAGVDRTTVSRILNRRMRPGQYLPATVRRVDAAAKTLGYRKNLAALALKGGSSLTVGLVIADISNVFFSEVAFHLDRLCRKAGYNLLICNSEEDGEIERNIFRTLADRVVDGVILSPADVSEAHLRKLAEIVRHIVVFDRANPRIRMPSVTVDNLGGALSAMERLLTLGHRDIAIIGGIVSDPSIAARIAGCRKALQRHKARVRREHLAESCNTEEAARAAARNMLQSPGAPTAIFTTSAVCSIGVIRAARDLQLHIPKDVSLIGFDDFPASDLLDPPIDVLRQPTEAIARETFRVLMEDIRAPRARRAEQLSLPVELVLRGSSRPMTQPAVQRV